MAEGRSSILRHGRRRTAAMAMTPPTRTAKVSTSALRTAKDGLPLDPTLNNWRESAYRYVNTIGELGYAMHLKANVLASCNFRIRERSLGVRAKLLPSGAAPDLEWDVAPGAYVYSVDERAQRVLEALQGPVGGLQEIMRRGALGYEIGGEAYLLGTAGDGGDIFWEFLSARELIVHRDGTMHRVRPMRPNEQLPDTTYVARWWRPDAEFADLADSSVKRVLPICQEIDFLTQYIAAVVRSRIASGMLYIDEDMSFGPDDEAANDEDGEDVDAMDPFLKKLLLHYASPVEDRSSAAALVPLVVTGDGPLNDRIHYIDLSRALDPQAVVLRDKAIERLAKGIDTPMEIVQGKKNLNHWTAFNVDHDFIVKHIVPDGEAMADFLTSSYLRPMLRTFEQMTAEEANRYVLEFDPSKVTTRPDAATSARTLHSEGLLSDNSNLIANGFTDADAPTEAEAERRMFLRIMEAAPNTPMAYLIAQKLFPDLHVPEELVVAPKPTPKIQGGSPAIEGGTNLTPPDKTSGQQEPIAAASALIHERLVSAADTHLVWAMERAAGRLVSKAQRDVGLRARLSGKTKDAVFGLVSNAELTSLGESHESLLCGSWDRLTGDARVWVRDYLQNSRPDMPASEAAALADTTVFALCNELSILAIAALSRPSHRYQNGLHVPDEIVAAALTAVIAPV